MLLLLKLREEYKARGSDATAATPVRPFAGYDEFFGNTPESHKTASLAALLGITSNTRKTPEDGPST
jgi:hypothetical protein